MRREHGYNPASSTAQDKSLADASLDWTAGYSSDLEYTAGYYREQAPGHLNSVCALNGCEPVETEAENLAELDRCIEAIMDKTVPLWRQLAML